VEEDAFEDLPAFLVRDVTEGTNGVLFSLAAKGGGGNAKVERYGLAGQPTFNATFLNIRSMGRLAIHDRANRTAVLAAWGGPATRGFVMSARTLDRLANPQSEQPIPRRSQ